MNEKTEAQLHKLWTFMAVKSCTEADKAIDPVRWYISTGRIDGEGIRIFNKLNGRELSFLARKLMPLKYDYTAAINAFNEYINVRRTPD